MEEEQALHAGSTPPNFILPDQDGVNHELASYRGSWVFLFFYPHDTIAGCVKEICSLRDHFAAFKKLDIVILGISPDSIENRKQFSIENNLPFPLLSDVNKKVADRYHAFGRDRWMNRESLSQMSFLINVGGEIEKIYNHVQPAKHASEVLVDIGKIQREDQEAGEFT
jgi:thioredoxin-dependent peroxiredoxin